jgi:RNA polymerase sigma factor (sigma-70 family)
MSERDDLDLRCRLAVEALDRREQWALSQAQVSSYARAIADFATVDLSDDRLDRVVIAYHSDHALVAALRDLNHELYQSAWEWAVAEVATAARARGLHWSRDRSVDIDDLVQTVMLEVSRSIGSYRFGSSLRTWLYSVVLNRLRRYHRDQSAIKRDTVLVPLEEIVEDLVDWGDVEEPIMASLLIEQICRTLSAAGDDRYAPLFLGRAVGGLSAEQIGAQVRLHPSRVRTLLREARLLLQQSDELRQWSGHADQDGDEDTP